jgi:hypothetical protein
MISADPRRKIRADTTDSPTNPNCRVLNCVKALPWCPGKQAYKEIDTLKNSVHAEYIVVFQGKLTKAEQEVALRESLGDSAWSHVPMSKPFTGDKGDASSDFAVIKVRMMMTLHSM